MNQLLKEYQTMFGDKLKLNTMNLTPGLNREFFEKMEFLYPMAAKHFKKWVYEYMVASHWFEVFQPHIRFPQLPYSVQQGIWITYCAHTLDNFFEQSEYTPGHDLETEIQNTLNELNPLIREEDL